MTSLKTSIKTITYLSDIGCLEIQGASLTIDLVVKNVIVITLDNANEESESYYQISCQFKFRHLDDQRRIEKILLDLILEAKRKKRI